MGGRSARTPVITDMLGDIPNLQHLLQKSLSEHYYSEFWNPILRYKSR